TIFFAVARRNPASGTITGALIGLTQDALTANFIGLYGMAKSIVGYAASSVAAKIDVENPGSRLILTFGFYLLQRAVYLLVQRGLRQWPARHRRLRPARPLQAPLLAAPENALSGSPPAIPE